MSSLPVPPAAGSAEAAGTAVETQKLAAPSLLEQRRLSVAIGLCLFAFLSGIYLITYSGVPYVGDEFGLAASVEGLVKWGEATVSQMSWFGYGPGTFEPGQIVLAAPIYWLAWHIPFVGNLQALYLFNVFVTALTAVVLFLYVRRLGYSPFISLTTALLYGLGTNAWVYSKTFFREPLSALLLIVAAYCLLGLRPVRLAKRSVSYGLAMALLSAVSIGAAVATKESNLVAVPIFGLYFVYYVALSIGISPSVFRRFLPIIGLAVGALTLSLAAVAYYNWATLGVVAFGLRNVLARIPDGLAVNSTVLEAFWTMPLNPGKGLFTHAPILMAGLAAPFLVGRRQGLAEMIFPLAFTASLMWLYAHAWSWIWWGGLTWGARYLVPALPFLAVTLAPVIHQVATSRRRALWVAFGLVCLLSILVQTGGISVRLDAYAEYLGRIREDASWTLAIYDGYYSEILGHLRILRLDTMDLAWLQMWDGQPLLHLEVPILAAGLSLAALAVFLRSMRRTPTARQLMALAAAAVILPVVMAGFALTRYYDDPRYRREAQWFTALDYLRAQERPGDVLAVNLPTHTQFFLNYDKAHLPWYGLNKEAWPPKATQTFRALLEFDRIWLATEFFPESDQHRGLERWLTENAFKVSDAQFGYPARLQLFVSPAAPAPSNESLQYFASFGNAIELWGAQYPTATLRAGDLLTTALYWRASRTPDRDYTVTLQLWDSEGRVVRQADQYPGAGFRPTSGWSAGDIVRDNYALALPTDLPDGIYRLVVGIYQWPSLQHLPLSAPESLRLSEPDRLLLAYLAVGVPSAPVMPYPILRQSLVQ
jgi:hypothetical protein